MRNLWGTDKDVGHRRDRGASSLEYAILASLLSIVAITAITVFGGEVKAYFQHALDLYQRYIKH